MSGYKILLNKINKEIDKLSDEINSIKKEMDLLDDAIDIVNKAVEKKIGNDKEFIESIVNSGLQFVFEGDIRFEMVHSLFGGKNVWEYKIEYDGVSGGIDSFGGGVMAVISFLLRVVINVKLGNKFMIIDESLNHLSSVYHNKMSKLINLLSHKFDMDIVMITHQNGLMEFCDKVFYLENKNGTVVVR